MTLQLQSASSRIKEFFLYEATEFEYTAPELSALLGLTNGGASGMLHRIKKHGAAEIIGMRDGHAVYRVEPTLMDDMHVKQSPGRGSDKGRTYSPRDRTKTSALPDLTEVNKAGSYDVISALLEAAGWLEAHKPTLDDFTTNDLIDELKRRMQK